MERFCMGCMRPLPPEKEKCPHCGYTVGTPNPDGTLPVGTTLSEHYTVGKVSDALGDGVRYIAYDTIFKNAIELFEFFPGALSERGEDGSLKTLGGCERAFADCADRYRKYIRTVGRTRDLPALVPVYDIFEENGTIYTVSEAIDAMPFDKWLEAQGGRISWEVLRPAAEPLLAALSQLHRAGIYHMGIAPENILIDHDGIFRLCHFSLPEARCASSDLTPRLVSGYSAPEQYAIDGECSGAADVYGCAALLYTALTGEVLNSANRRHDVTDLTLPVEVAQALPNNVRVALRDGLQPDASLRTDSMEHFRCCLLGLTEEPETPEISSNAQPAETDKKSRKGRLSIGAALGIALGAFALFIAGGLCVLRFGFPALWNEVFHGNAPTHTEEAPPTLDPLTEQPHTYDDPVEYFATADVVGKNYFQIKNTTLKGEMKAEVLHLESSDQPYGTILSQTPAAGESAEKGTTVKVVISAGPAAVAVPDVVSWPQEYALPYLEALGFRVRVMELTESPYPKGYVDSISPTVGTVRDRGEEVILYVSAVEDELPTEEPATAEPIE